MADKTPPKTDGPQPLSVAPVHILGAIQRILIDTHQYIAQPAYAVDRRVVMMALEEAAGFTRNLPPLESETADGKETRKAG